MRILDGAVILLYKPFDQVLMKETILILSCEHASPHLPHDWQHLFLNLTPSSNLNDDFKRFDPYAKELSVYLAKQLNCELRLGEISRLLIDLNKSEDQEHCFANNILEKLSEKDKKSLLEDYYYPFRHDFADLLKKHIQNNQQVLHLSIHTFNPVEKGKMHNAAIGLLYDPKRHAEKEVARIFHEILIKRTPYKVRLNYPRAGKTDNHTSSIRKYFDETCYLGIELECNALLLGDSVQAPLLYENLFVSVQSLLELL